MSVSRRRRAVVEVGLRTQAPCSARRPTIHRRRSPSSDDVGSSHACIIPSMAASRKVHASPYRAKTIVQISASRHLAGRHVGREDHVCGRSRTANFNGDIRLTLPGNDSRSGFRRVSFRVSLHWKNPKTQARRRKNPTESENAKSLIWRA